jgi:hypothetical protein
MLCPIIVANKQSSFSILLHCIMKTLWPAYQRLNLATSFYLIMVQIGCRRHKLIVVYVVFVYCEWLLKLNEHIQLFKGCVIKFYFIL